MFLEQQISILELIFEGPRDTDWVIDAENVALITGIGLNTF